MASYVRTLKAGSDEIYPRTKSTAITNALGVNLETVLGSIDTNKVTVSTQADIEAAINNCFPQLESN